VVKDCLACDLAAGRLPLPGGIIHETSYWLVEHSVGSLGVGTLIVKPRRHVTRVAQLEQAEAEELGPLLQQTAAVVDDLAAECSDARLRAAVRATRDPDRAAGGRAPRPADA